MMTTKRTARKQELKDRLIAVTRARINTNGLANLRARDIATDAGCALGSLYTVFADLDDLIIHANAVTLDQLHTLMKEAGDEELAPQDRLVRLAQEYLNFALNQRHSWAALFDHLVADDYEIPSWHLQNHTNLFDHIMQPLADVHPELDPDTLHLRSRTIFSAVHGIIEMSLKERFVSVPVAQLRSEITRFVIDYVAVD